MNTKNIAFFRILEDSEICTAIILGRGEYTIAPSRKNFKEGKCYPCQSSIAPLNTYIQRRNDIFLNFC